MNSNLRSDLLLKIFAVILIIPLIALIFGGCSKQHADESAGSAQAGSSSSASSPSSSESGAASSVPESTPANENALTQSIRYARPFFRTTLDMAEFDPKAFADYEELGDFLKEGSEQFPAADPSKDYFEVKTGDVLENALIATVEPAPIEGYTLLKLDGKLTMEGVLYLEKEDHDYIFRARDLMFYPDCVENSSIPTCGDEITICVFSGMQGVSCDGNPYFLGNIDDVDVNEREIFGDNEVVKVKVTVENITFDPEKTVYDISPRADIVSIERLD